MPDGDGGAAALPSEAEVISWFDTLSNWGRWGADDVLGTLNHITPERRVEAARLVRSGRAVSCAWDVRTEGTVDQVFGPPMRHMLATGEGLSLAPAGADVDGGGSSTTASPGPGAPVADAPSRGSGAAEWVGFAFHGYSVTHLDALSHMFWDGRMYGGHPAGEVTVREGARRHAVTSAPDGLIGRGVLLDVAGIHGGEWLTPGQYALPHDLEAAEERHGVRVGPGDLVLLRTGYGLRKRRHGPDDVGAVGRAGWHAACLPWLAEREVAMIGADTAQDVHPSGYAGLRSPVHLVGIVAMGLWLLDNCDLEPLTDACLAEGRWEFLLSVLPLRLEGATGSPVNPVALL